MIESSKEAKSERVQNILMAALDEFSDCGFSAARLDSIAERAGVAKGTIYLYFDGKETLFEEAARAVIGPMIDRIEALAAKPEAPAATILSDMLRTFYSDVIKDPRKRRLLHLIISEGPRFKRLLRFYHAEIVSRGMRAVRVVVAHGIKRGEFQNTAVIDFPQILFGPAFISALWTILFNDIEPLDLERYCDVHLNFALNGLRGAG